MCYPRPCKNCSAHDSVIHNHLATFFCRCLYSRWPFYYRVGFTQARMAQPKLFTWYEPHPVVLPHCAGYWSQTFLHPAGCWRLNLLHYRPRDPDVGPNNVTLPQVFMMIPSVLFLLAMLRLAVTTTPGVFFVPSSWAGQDRPYVPEPTLALVAAPFRSGTILPVAHFRGVFRNLFFYFMAVFSLPPRCLLWRTQWLG